MKNENFNTQNEGAASSTFLKEIDEIITQLEQSFSQLPTKELTMNTKNLEGQKTTYADKPHESQDLARKAFLNYVAKGDINLESKSYLLSSEEQNGGYLIPGSTLDQIEEQLKCLCPLRSLAKVQTIRSHALELLIDKSSAEAGWMLSDQMDDDSALDLTKIQIATHALYAKPKASQKILDDAGEMLEEWVVSKITKKMAQMENQAFLYGNGEHQPKGLLKYPFVAIGEGDWGTIECIDIQGQTPEITRDALLGAISSLKAEYHTQAVWLMSRSAFVAIQKITDSLGHFLWQPSLTMGTPSCLLGYPVIVCDDMPNLSDKEISVPILFGDFSAAYQIVDNGEMSVLRDPYSVKPYVEFYATKRVGGDVVNFDAVKAIRFQPVEKS